MALLLNPQATVACESDDAALCRIPNNAPMIARGSGRRPGLDRCRHAD
jgi:hypothetical protein